MQYATTVNEILNAVNPRPLDGDSQFYVETMEARTGNPCISPIQDIMDACEFPQEQNAMLLLGHRGCGKSTELNKMSAHLEQEGYPVYTVYCEKELDPLNIEYTDILILMGDSLLQLAGRKHIALASSLISAVHSFWRTAIEEEKIVESGVDIEGSAGLNALFILIKGILKYNASRRTIWRTTVERKSSEWLNLLGQVIAAISEVTGGKQPVLIFEDLDKLAPEAAWRVFSNYSKNLSSLPSPVIYTFPIALYFSPEFTAIDGFFKYYTLPMIKVHEQNGERCGEGFDTIRDIIRKRINLELFQGDLLDTIIEKTGGSLRNLFNVIENAGKLARRRGSRSIEQSDVNYALTTLKSDITRRLDDNYYDFLAEIANGQHEKITMKEKLLDMLQAGAVLEYNGKRWHDVHPLVKDFLEEQNLL